MFVAEEDDGLVVVEGNRRLAAVRVLTTPRLQRKLRVGGLPRLTKQVRESIESLPVIVCPRQTLWQYVGFKHLNGPQEWDSIAKAEYIHNTFHNFKVPLEEIARTIGDTNETVMRLYRGYSVLTQAEATGQFHRSDCWSRKFPFSHLWTALGYQKVRKFLGLHAGSFSKVRPVPKNKESDLVYLMRWIYGSRSQDIEPKVKSQNPDLRLLVEALGTTQGVASLRGGLSFSVAVEASRGDERLFHEALTRSEKQLKETKRFVATGYHGDAEMLEIAKRVAKIAESLLTEMCQVAEHSGAQTSQEK